MDESVQEGNEIRFPVDDATYDLLQTLTSKLEALDAYRTYMDDAEDDDDPAAAGLYRQMAQDDMRHAERLLELVRQRLTQS